MDDLVKRDFLIFKRGRGWYRADSQGYTSFKFDAGRYTEQEAKAITHPNGPEGPRDGMFYKHEDEVRDDPSGRIEALTAERDAAEAKLAQAVGLLRECADDLAAYVEHDFPLESRERYSSVKKRYERDMELVYETRAFLATIQKEGETDDKA